MIKKEFIELYPILNTHLIRGACSDFYLQNYKNGIEYFLSGNDVGLFHDFDGKNNIRDLSKKHKIEIKNIREVVNNLQKERIIKLLTKKNTKTIFPSLSSFPSLNEVQLELTGNCNLWCKHCYGRRNFEKIFKDQIAKDQLFDCLDEMEAMNVSRIIISGGETFLYKELPCVIEYIARKKIHIGGIFTNGTIIRDEVFESLRKHAITTTFLISLDGPSSEIHDYIRGIGNFDKTINFIKKTINSGFRVTINTVVMKPNIKVLSEMYPFLENLGVSRWRISIPREQGEAVANKKNIIPDWDDIFVAYKKIFLMAIKNKGKMKIQLSSLFKTEFLENGQYYLYNSNNGCCGYKRNSLVLEANGSIIACPASLDLSLGNIKDNSLKKIWSSNLTQAIKTLPIKNTKCVNCEINKICGAGCRIMAKKLKGSYFEIDPNACPLYNFFCKEIKPILDKLGIKAVNIPQAKKYLFNKSIIEKAWRG